MKYWLDTEFIEDGKTIDLISIGIVAEDGRLFYAESREADWGNANQWVIENVKPHIVGPHWKRSEIRDSVSGFCAPAIYGKPEFWGYYADYDWVVLCQLFGTMMDLPKGWPMYCRDLRQWLDDNGLAHVTQPDDMPHNALSDAQWIAKTWTSYQLQETAGARA